MRPAWFPDWSDAPAALVASGQSATPAAVAALRGRCRVLVVNTSYRLAPWADALYACDGRWWEQNAGAPDFLGLRITQDARAAARWGLHQVQLVDASARDPHRIVVDRPGVLGRGLNSGFQALNLLVQLGVRRIPLLGVDLCGRRWHAPHPGRGHQLPETLAKWRAILDAQAPALAALGVDVVNLSPASALTAFPKLGLEAALARWERAAA